MKHYLLVESILFLSLCSRQASAPAEVDSIASVIRDDVVRFRSVRNAGIPAFSTGQSQPLLFERTSTFLKVLGSREPHNRIIVSFEIYCRTTKQSH